MGVALLILLLARSQRLGGDYLDDDNVNNWNIGSASIFIWGVGLLPFKDTFLSNSTQTPPTHANTGTGSGGFKGFHEQAPELHAISGAWASCWSW